MQVEKSKLNNICILGIFYNIDYYNTVENIFKTWMVTETVIIIIVKCTYCTYYNEYHLSTKHLAYNFIGRNLQYFIVKYKLQKYYLLFLIFLPKT